MQKNANPLWFNILSFSFNLFIFSLPLYVGFQVYNAFGAEPFAALSLILYLIFLVTRMTKIGKALSKGETF